MSWVVVTVEGEAVDQVEVTDDVTNHVVVTAGVHNAVVKVPPNVEVVQVDFQRVLSPVQEEPTTPEPSNGFSNLFEENEDEENESS